MSVTLLLPGALMPREVARALAQPVAATALASLLAKAEASSDSESEGPPHLAWLAEQMFQRALPLATAPYAYADLAGERAPSEFLWHADPVHLAFARDHLVLAPLGDPPDAEETTVLMAAANALAAEAGLEFVSVRNHWFLRASSPWDLETVPLAAALGRPLHALLPGGRDAARWNRLLTELQMTWHEHPVNEAREARGKRAINSVWLHGGGRWEALPRAAWCAVHADEPEWRGGAMAAGVAKVFAAGAHNALAPARAATGAREARPADDARLVGTGDWPLADEVIPRDDALVVWSDLLAPRQLQDWTAWTQALAAIDQRLASLARTSTLDLVLTGESTLRRLRTRPSDRLKFWRATPFEQVLSE